MCSRSATSAKTFLTTAYRIKLRACVKQMTKTEQDSTAVRSRRTRLRNRILASNKLLGRLLLQQGNTHTQQAAHGHDLSDEDNDVSVRQAQRHGYNLRDAAEDLPIDLPSARTFSQNDPPDEQAKAAIRIELRLCYTAMDVALSLLRRGLVDQAYIFRRDIRQSASSGNIKLGYDAAKKAREHAHARASTNNLHAATYRALRSCMEKLHWDKVSRMGRTAWDTQSEHYRSLTNKDTQCTTATYDVKDHSGRLELPWFWKLNRRAEHSVDDDEYIADCKYLPVVHA